MNACGNGWLYDSDINRIFLKRSFSWNKATYTLNPVLKHQAVTENYAATFKTATFLELLKILHCFDSWICLLFHAKCWVTLLQFIRLNVGWGRSKWNAYWGEVILTRRSTSASVGKEIFNDISGNLGVKFGWKKTVYKINAVKSFFLFANYHRLKTSFALVTAQRLDSSAVCKKARTGIIVKLNLTGCYNTVCCDSALVNPRHLLSTQVATRWKDGDIA